MQQLNWNVVRKFMKNTFHLRLKMVEMAMTEGVSAAAQAFGTTRRTVYKWLERFKQEGLEGLKERSRAPKNHPRKIPDELEASIVAIRRKKPFLGPIRIQEEYQLPCSCSTVYRVLRKHGLIRQRKRRHHTKRDLRRVKIQLKAFEKVQIDVKRLDDIPNYFPYYYRGFPRYQFTARDVRTGASFICFADELSSTNAAIFAHMLLQHFHQCGVNLTALHIQTDNGSEFVTPVNLSNPGAAFRASAFQKVLQQWRVPHVRIPPAQKTFNSDVEAFHRIIEDEFYDVEKYRSRAQLLQKSATYMLYFNLMRKNRYKNNLAPAEIIERLSPTIQVRRLFQFQPVILDLYLTLLHSSFNTKVIKGVYHVMKPDNKILFTP